MIKIDTHNDTRKRKRDVVGGESGMREMGNEGGKRGIGKNGWQVESIKGRDRGSGGVLSGSV